METAPKQNTLKIKQHLIWFAPLMSIILGLMLLSSGVERAIAITASISAWTILWWVFEPVPIPVTSLLPIALLPFFGILTPSQVGEAYGSPLILLMLGGFILSTAMEHSGAHKRLALLMVNTIGSESSKRLVFAFMVAAAVLSMWISNTATTLMLLPVVLAIISSTDKKDIAMPMLLGLAFAANLGGIGTPIGTPPNLVFMQVYKEFTGNEIAFLEWMKWAVPIILVFLPIMALWLTRGLSGSPNVVLPKVGEWRIEEKRVLMVFALTACAWMFRKEPFGGWSAWFGFPKANDASVALLAVILMFIIPNGKGGKLLNWKKAETIPWGILLLFGGGICIAKAFQVSGLSQLVGESLAEAFMLPILLVIFLVAISVSFLTETTSNTASTVLLLPVLATAAMVSDIDPLILMFPATISASCAFMLPVATAPNAVVFSSGKICGTRMVREGVVLNITGAVIVTLFCALYFIFQ